jgi:hypothetical protein
MAFEFAPLFPAFGTVAAALVAGGVARANLIASKESKISEFRQTWIDALRDDLATLFSSARIFVRAIEETRAEIPEIAKKFLIPPEKIIEARHGSSEAYHRIRLRLNANQTDHKELLLLLSNMMDAVQDYLGDQAGKAGDAIVVLEKAATCAERVLKAEWETVKLGERDYREALAATAKLLRSSIWVLGVLVIAVPFLFYWWTSRVPAAAQTTVPVTATLASAAPKPVPAAAPPAAAGTSPR